MQNITTFDTKRRYIFLPVFVTGSNGKPYEFDAILDTGAPCTEFSDSALQFAGLLQAVCKEVSIQPGLQTQKYSKIVLPRIEICSQPLTDLQIYVSRFEKSWGIDVLIGLDFFRRFRTTIDYKAGHLVTERFYKDPQG